MLPQNKENSNSNNSPTTSRLNFSFPKLTILAMAFIIFVLLLAYLVLGNKSIPRVQNSSGVPQNRNTPPDIKIRTQNRRTGIRSVVFEGKFREIPGLPAGTIDNLNMDPKRFLTRGYIEKIDADKITISLNQQVDCKDEPGKMLCGQAVFWGAANYYIIVAHFDPKTSPPTGLLSANLSHFAINDWVQIEAPLPVLEAKTGEVTALYGMQ